MKEDFYEKIGDYLRGKFPNHSEVEYEEASVYLSCLLIIERDNQLKAVMRKGVHR